MANFSTWLLAIFMVMFWIFRIIVTLCTQYSIELFGLVAYNFNLEVIIVFVTLLCIILVIKRKLLGSLLYLVIYGGYFGEHLINNIMLLTQKQAIFDMTFAADSLADFIAILLAIFVLFDMLIDKSRKSNAKDKKTDWYFKDDKYDEELKARDKREDNNEYKFY